MTHSLYIGVMSGTSLDGIDLVLARFPAPDAPFAPMIEAFSTMPFDAGVRAELLALMAAPASSAADLLGLHVALGELFGEAVATMLTETGTDPAAVTALGLHGLTVHHQPTSVRVLGREVCGTLQLGDAARVRRLSGVRVVHDFRAADMAVGGQGAPLAPYLDRLLFERAGSRRVLLNLGGIANLTVFQPGKPAVAFDAGPANMLVDLLMETHPTAPASYDAGGARAAAGRELPAVLARCLAHPYFAAPPPKSTGRELFGRPFLESHLAEPGAAADDLIATATRLSARTVAGAVTACLGDLRPDDRLICAGGGVHNHTLMAMLRAELAPMQVGTTADEGLDPDAKEALLMATLAWSFDHGLPGNLPEVTGARAPVVLGTTTA